MGIKQGLLAVALLAVTVMVVVLIETIPRGEGPVYNGKHLSAWLKELPGKGYNVRGIAWTPIFPPYNSNELAACEAVRHMGTNALPFLMSEMHVNTLGPMDEAGAFWGKLHDALLRTFLHKQVVIQTPQRHYKNSSELRHWQAARGLHALGPLAEPALPEVVKMLSQSDSAPDAAYALSGMGSNGHTALIESLTNNNSWVGMCAIWALGQATNTEAVVPLVGVLTNTDAGLRMAATWALGQIAAEPELVAPALAGNLGDTAGYINMRPTTETALTRYGIESVSEWALKNYLNDPKLSVRMAATNALRVLYSKKP